MKNQLRIAQFICILLLFLTAGVMWGTWFSLSRSIQSIAPETFLGIGHAMIANLATPMSIIMPLGLLSLLPVLFLLFQQKRMAAFYLTLCGLACFVAVLGITLTVNVPIDNQITHWTIETLPQNWEMIRDRWEFHHALRTLASVVGLGFVVIAALI